MQSLITGLHHITAIASDPQVNIDFYVGLLGLRLIKKTVNFDDPSAYHLYYGDAEGTPGTIVTFFYWPHYAARGRTGTGQSTTLTFSAPTASLEYWEKRLKSAGATVQRTTRLDEIALRFHDPDHLPVEIVGTNDDRRSGWTLGTIPAQHALRGFHSSELSLHPETQSEVSHFLREILGFRIVVEHDNQVRLAPASSNGESGTLLDLKIDPSLPNGRQGAGTIHHIAWSVPNDAAEAQLQRRLHQAHRPVSPVRERNYFRSIYFPEPSGSLFEIATVGPGFAIDEPLDALGFGLQLPAQFEPQRDLIEQSLPPLVAPRPFSF